MTGKFLWGVASSGYQCEGGYNAPGQPHNNWATAEETGRIMRTGQAPIHWYVTLNEPNMLVLNTYLNRHFPGGGTGGLRIGLAAYNRLLSAHVLAYNAIHDHYEAHGWSPPAVTMNTFCSDVYWSEKLLLDLLCVRERKIPRPEIKAYLLASSHHLHRALKAAKLPFKVDPFVWLARGIHHLTNFFAPRSITEEALGPFLDVLDQSRRDRVLDYLGMDYYDPFAGHLLRAPSFADLEFKSLSFQGRLMDSLSRKWWDWHMLPEGLHFFCHYYAKEYQRGILVAENGMALRRSPDNQVSTARKDSLTRSEFLTAHVTQIRRLIAEGVPMLGYLHWSLTDNYEWGSYTPRFGLFSIDYTNDAARSATDHLGDNPSATYARLIAAARRERNKN